MTETAHTPGPWHRNIRPAAKYTTVFAGHNKHVAAIQSPHGMTDEEVEANCNLIVAAPEMLAALIALAGKISSFHDADSVDAALHILADMEATINTVQAKAEGRSP